MTTAASGRLFRKGLLIKDGTALERMSEADTVVFDKTGTLTTGAPEPVGLDSHPDEAMGVALALAEASSHPLAEALSAALRARGLRPARIEGATEAPGYGVEGIWRGKPVRLGRAAWVGAEAPDVTATFLKLGDDAPRAIRFNRHLARGRGPRRSPRSRPRARRVILLSGDTRGAVQSFADRNRHRGGHRRGAAAGKGRSGGAALRGGRARSDGGRTV